MIQRYNPPKDKDVIKVESLDQLTNDVRHCAIQQFVVDDTFVNSSEFKEFILEYKGKQILERLKDIRPKMYP